MLGPRQPASSWCHAATGWIAETQPRRTAAKARMRPGPQRARISREEITHHRAEIRDVASALATADPTDKATLYGQLGLSLTYHPNAKRINVKAQPMSGMYIKRCPRGDLNPHAREISPNWEIIRTIIQGSMTPMLKISPVSPCPPGLLAIPVDPPCPCCHVAVMSLSCERDDAPGRVWVPTADAHRADDRM